MIRIEDVRLPNLPPDATAADKQLLQALYDQFRDTNQRLWALETTLGLAPRIPSVVDGTGTVTSVGVSLADGITGSVANSTTSAVISLGLGAITPDSMAAGDDSSIAGDLTLPKTSGVGIKVDTAAPTFGWHDILGDITIRTAGSNDPTFSVYQGNVRQFEFSATAMKEIYVVYHIPHDYLPGSDVFFHTHWSNAAAAPNTGNVIWGFEYSHSKGHGQGPFSTPATVTVTQACPAARYTHNIAETAAVTLTGLEPDSLILCRVYRDAAAGGDTCTDTVFLHFADVHYQSTNMSTKQKAPNFYT